MQNALQVYNVPAVRSYICCIMNVSPYQIRDNHAGSACKNGPDSGKPTGDP